MSRRHKGLPIDGVLLLDKSPGMSSNLALQKARRLYQARKAGHTGSLDPLATGLLPVCLGEATKLSAYLLDDDKRYVTTVRLGRTTTTADSEGETLEVKPVPHFSESDIESVLAGFRGDIEQFPPMYSALKHQGRRLYELARQGVEVERAARSVSIYSLELLAFGPDSLELEVHCSKGTYIRSLAEDIGNMLGCGAHVERLRRTAVGCFDVARAHTLADLEALTEQQRLDLLLPADSAVEGLPAVWLGESQTHFIRHGQAVLAPKAPTDSPLRLYSRELGFLGMGEVNDEGLVAPRRLFVDPIATRMDAASLVSAG
ncbi:tRNA pseudouridine(55) synthase TruB [Methylococcus sp. EFPC2]|uniref:tRNA pseudouridine(55) synthase TruB n=1 Tax=Methylococcus sp. EFPC2 TaxID=2812648 RepID=UPI0019685262|nr:tRNA pseudouridine(55) synthase TruB [Methylococcus sp. EFPC2]QSA97595.1 tRNA pseudouridine(55) synthase TruB [Methylococcus sp. EFPC2]